MATFFHSGSWPVPVGCYSIFVLEHAVDRRFAEGADEFERRLQVLRRQEGLFMLVAFTKDEMVEVSRRLAMAGLFVGSDFAITGPSHGPIHECPGVVFWDCCAPSGRSWRVKRQQASTASYGPSPALDPAIIDRAGRLLPSLSIGDDAGVVLAHRERRDGHRVRNEYLCVFRGSWGFELNVHRYRWLGDIPDDWFDEEDELLPEHRDRTDHIILPATWDGQQVMGEECRGFIGTLEPIDPKADVQISDGSEGLVRAALASLGWHERSVSIILGGLAMLVDAVALEREQEGQPVPEAAPDPCVGLPPDPPPSLPRAPDPNWQRRVTPLGGLVTWVYLGDEEKEA